MICAITRPIKNFKGGAPLLLAAALFGSGSLHAQSSAVTMTYLGNMGVLLESARGSVVIDALHRAAPAQFTAVPSRLLEPLENAREPFRTIDAALTTHRHADHFDAHSVARRLAADSSIVYVAAAETIDSLRARVTNLAEHSRTRRVSNADHAESALLIGDIEVKVLDLPHNPTSSRRVANVGFLIELGGLNILHVGDADPVAANFQRHNLAARRIDVALVPFWYLSSADVAVRRAIGARIWVATHIPPSNTGAVRRQVLARVPDAIVLITPGEHRVLR